MLDTSLFKEFDTPGAVAHGLPASAYTSKEFLELEYQSLFANNWVLAGFAHDLVRSGDVRPVC